MSAKILWVDDEQNILDAIQRQLRHRFEVVVALGGEKALETLVEQGPFGVVVSDLQMPGMSGMEFLGRVRTLFPECIRVIFSGRTDREAAIAAVNDGNIFRFLTKPSPPETLSRALEQAIEQHRLVVAERELLEKTLRGSVQVLVDILSLLNPSLFSRSNRIQTYALHIANELNASRWKWQLGLAAMLSQVGCITLSEKVVAKSLANETFTAAERTEFASHPATGAKLIGNIPRLESVAKIIALQQQPFYKFKKAISPANGSSDQALVDFGAQALRAAIGFDRLRSRSLNLNKALEMLRSEDGDYNPEMVSALVTIDVSAGTMQRIQVCVEDLKPKMITLSDIYSTDGMLVLAQDQEISIAMVAVLQRFRETRGIREPISVLAPVTNDTASWGLALAGPTGLI